MKLTSAGRKYRYGLIGLLVLLVCFFITSVAPVLTAVYPSLVTGVAALFTIYCGGNVGASLAAKKKEDKPNGDDNQ